MFYRRLSLLLLSLIFLAALAACGGSPAPAIPSATPSGPTAPAIPTITRTPVPTETARPSATPPAALTATPLPTAAPTADGALAQAELLGITWMKNYNMLVSFEFPGPVEVDQYRVTVEDKDYPCQQIEKFPNRLYCIGPGVKVLTTALVQVYPAGADQPGFEKAMWIPFFDNKYSDTVGDTLDEDFSKLFNP